jgi:hypothetical protein
MSGRESSWQPMVSVENFHRSARAPPAIRRHAGHIRINYDSAGHSPTSRLCRLPGSWSDPQYPRRLPNRQVADGQRHRVPKLIVRVRHQGGRVTGLREPHPFPIV